MNRLVFPLLIGLIIPAGCANQAPQKSIITACSAYATALNGAAAFREAGRLSMAQVSFVDRIRPVANALCEGPLPTDVLTSVATVEAVTAQLVALVGSK